MPTVKHIESTISKVEGFEVTIMHPTGTDVRGNKKLSKNYSGNKMSKNAWTVSRWKDKFQVDFPGYDVEVLNAEGESVRGNTNLSTVRDTYSDEG
ncbi:MAG: hypothetical protein MI749_21335 [Desulfovibrionales bacterium]|nr:hypothetical protein [Desulfovibrionales bacterium]